MIPGLSPRGNQALTLALAFGGMVALFVLVDALSYYAPNRIATAAVLGTAAALLLTTLVEIRVALIAFTVWLVLSDDISRRAPTAGDPGLVSMLTLPVGGVALANLLAVGLVAIALLAAAARWARAPRPVRVLLPDAAVAGIVALYLLSTLLGWPWVEDNPRGALNAWNLPIMTAGLYAAFRVTPWPPAALRLLWQALLLAVGAKALVWTGYFALGIGVPFGGIVRVGFESGRVLLVLLVAAACAAWVLRTPASLSARLLWAGLAVFAGFQIFVHAGRMEWLFAALAIVLVWLLSPARGKVRVALGVATIGLAGFGLIASYNPGIIDTLSYFANTLKFWDEEQVTSSRSTMVRVYEFRNIRAELAEAGRTAIGLGPGGSFTDRHHPFPFDLTEDDFSLAERMSRRFQSAHGLLQNTLLTLGIAGTALYLVALGTLYAVAVGAYRRVRMREEQALVLALIGFLPAMMYLTWSAKTNMLFGILLGIIGVIVARIPVRS